MLIMVTLNVVRSPCSNGNNVNNLQSTDTEHERNGDLLPPMKIQSPDPRQGQEKHPKIQSNADDGVHPGDRIDVDTSALSLAIPPRPVERDRGTLEDADEDEDDSIDSVEDNRGP